jgi:hypothetical protein
MHVDVVKDSHKKQLSKFRLSAYCLEIVVSRFSYVHRSERKYNMCYQYACESE